MGAEWGPLGLGSPDPGTSRLQRFRMELIGGSSLPERVETATMCDQIRVGRVHVIRPEHRTGIRRDRIKPRIEKAPFPLLLQILGRRHKSSLVADAVRTESPDLHEAISIQQVVLDGASSPEQTRAIAQQHSLKPCRPAPLHRGHPPHWQQAVGDTPPEPCHRSDSRTVVAPSWTKLACSKPGGPTLPMA